MKWFFSVAVTKNVSGGYVVRHGLGVVKAGSHDEALGKAIAVGNKMYPLKGGWRNHHTMVLDEESDPMALEDIEEVKED